MRISFRTQTVVAIMSISLLVSAGLALLSIEWSEQLEKRFLFKQEQMLLREIQISVAPFLGARETEKAQAALLSVAADTSVLHIRLLDAEGQPIAQVGDTENLNPDYAAAEVENGIYRNQARLYYQGQFLADVQLGLSASASAGLLLEMRLLGLGFYLPVFGLVAAFSYIIGSLLTARLRSLTRVADTIAEQGPGVTLKTSGNDEIARVARSMNEMSENLAISYRQLKYSVQEQRVLSRKLAEREKTQRKMLSSALDGVISIDIDGNIVDFNAAAEQIFGYRREQIVGKEMAGLIVPRHFREAHRRGMEHYKGTREGPVLGKRLEIEGMRRNGEIFPIELSIVDVEIGGRHLFTGFVRDITERKRADEELRLSASAFETREGIFITDGDSMIVRVNQAFEDMTGYDREEIMDRSPDELITADPEVEGSELTWGQLITGGAAEGAEPHIRKKDGTLFPVWLGWNPVIDDKGVLTHYVAHFIDMSDRKQFEKELDSARIEAEEANQAKSRFLTNMSHEIRTPLNAIVNLNELLLDTDLTQEQQNMARTAHQGGKALGSLVNSVLDLSKIESGRFTINTHPFNLRRMVDELDSLFTPQAQSAGLELRIELGPEVPDWLEGDEMRLRQVLFNLVGNSLKFTHHGFVGLALRHVRSEDGGERIHFRIDDSGIGIPEDKAKRIFEEFYQTDASMARRYGGTGLGLAISQLLIDMMGGRIRYEPRDGGGSSFWFDIVLPVSEAIEEEAEADMAPVAARVLLAEDSIANQLVARTILEKAGCTVEVAHNGKEAVEAVANSQYDMVFMDVSMPEMDGLEATRIIRSQGGHGSEVPIAAMTANVFESDRQNCLDAGMDDFVGKPIEARKLRACLQRWIKAPAAKAMRDEPPEPGTEQETDTMPHPAAAENGSPVMDDDALARMERDTSTEMLAQLIGIFVSESRGRLEELAACADKPLEDLVSAAHAIKSSASTFGAQRLCEEAAELEQLAKSGEDEPARNRIGRVLDTATATIEAFSERFGPWPGQG